MLRSRSSKTQGLRFQGELGSLPLDIAPPEDLLARRRFREEGPTVGRQSQCEVGEGWRQGSAKPVRRWQPLQL
jgi:hypothetical protein